MSMYLGVAGACAEQKANASVAAYTLENINFQDSSDATGYTPVELLIGGNQMLIAHEPGSAEKIHAFAFDDTNHPAWATADDTLSLTNKNPRALVFGDNGNYLYVGGTVASSNIVRHTLSTAYDIGTAGATQTVNSSLYSSGAQGLAFNDTGTKLFVADGGSVITLTLTTAWNLSAGTKATNSFTSVTDSDGDALNNFTGIRFNADGTKMFISYRNSFGDEALTANHAKIAEFNLTTAYTVSTAAFVRSLDTHPQLGYYDFVPAPPPPSTRPTLIAGFDWNSDGTALFVAAVHVDALSTTGPKILRYTFD